MTISKKIESIVAKSSWIRKMFEEGARLIEIHGPENVFDFSIGNPQLKPPPQFQETLLKIVAQPDSYDHRYMANTGYPFARKAVADYLSQEQQLDITEQEVIMTSGAGGAVNVILKAILDPADEVIILAPYFVEYKFYIDNHGGVFKVVPTKQDFTLDLEAIANALTDKTKAVLINSPNNPTGQLYSQESITALGDILRESGRKYGHMLYLISDEPYRKIVFDGQQVPSIFHCYENSIVAYSYSKDISIPGERIGFLAVNPRATYKKPLVDGMALANRILGFVNANALMQRVIAQIQGAHVDLEEYARKRDLLCAGLQECGYEFVKPTGAFYVFPKSPIPDDVEFVQKLKEELIFVVPGSGFGGPGHFRIAFCVSDETITNALPGFARVLNRYQ